MSEESRRRTLTVRDFALVIFIAAMTGFVGGFVGGLLTGDVHVYVDSFTGQGHNAGEINPAAE